ncbi:hypothetical protein PENTCL1PPCAC_15936 [Pristionchus entomophagus]|uniref:TIL domain-containing protein n=1 Tax=Pristionchus entomophagus TaxID=358040 RepID=A0AAV5THG2_9BILA|nr:hypothetical protein PENTCL1PPCAC_15936 [Pristionchus entomophagus]
MKLLILIAAALTYLYFALAQPSCEGVACADFQHCQLELITTCFAPPCKPVPGCVSNSTECTLPCSSEHICVLEKEHCKDEPCPPSKPSCFSSSNATEVEPTAPPS